MQKLGKIKAFQRDEGSGSQSALLRLMEGKTLTEPIKDEVSGDMGGIINTVADYKNFKNAIGFSFRFYCTEMVNNNQIKLLGVNGVKPTEENVENGSYPISNSFLPLPERIKRKTPRAFWSGCRVSRAGSLLKRRGILRQNKLVYRQKMCA